MVKWWWKVTAISPNTSVTPVGPTSGDAPIGTQIGPFITVTNTGPVSVLEGGGRIKADVAFEYSDRGIMSGQTSGTAGIVQWIYPGQSITAGLEPFIITPYSLLPPVPVECDEGFHKDLKTGECVPDLPTPSTGLDKLEDLIEHPPNILNPGEVLTWLGNVFGAIGQIIWDVPASLVSLLWSLLPPWLRKAIEDAQKSFKALYDFMADPTSFMEKVVVATFKEASPSIIDTCVQGVSGYYNALLQKYNAEDPDSPKKRPAILVEVEKLGKEIGSMIGTATNPESVEGRVYQLDTTITKVFLSLITAQQIFENVPTLNKTGSANLMLAYVQAKGLLSAIRSTIEPYMRINIDRQMNYALNAKYHNVIPSIGDLERLRDIGKWTDGEWRIHGPQVTGIDANTLEQIREAKHQVPTFEDFVTWNERHPTEKLDIEAHQDLLGMNFTDWGKVLMERRYSDIPARTLRMVFATGAISVEDVDFALRRARFRPEPLTGQAKSDFQIMHDYVTGAKEQLLEKQELSSTEKLFLQGELTVEELRIIAAKVYHVPSELDTYMRTAANASALREAKPKHFVYSLLIKMAELGVDTSAVLDSDLAATGLDATHQALLKQYIEAVIAAKLAKATTSP